MAPQKALNPKLKISSKLTEDQKEWRLVVTKAGGLTINDLVYALGRALARLVR